MSTALFVAWHSGGDTDGRWGPIGRLEHAGGSYTFMYTKGARHLKGFRPLIGMPDLKAVYRSDELFPVFANRLLTRSRRDYDAYLRWSGFDPSNPPDPISILAVTEGRRETDALEVFPCPVPDAYGFYINKFFAHRVRLMPDAAIKRIDQLATGEELGLMADFANAHDVNALALRTTGDSARFLIGYVPRYLAQDVRRLLRDNRDDVPRVTVERLNSDAPLQHRLLCRMRARWPDRFSPCQDESYEPITTEAQRVAA